MRQNLLLAAVLLLATAAQADRSSSWWRDSSSSAASLSDSHARTSGPGAPDRTGPPGTGRVASYQRAAQDGLEPLQQVGGQALQSRISKPTLSRTPASTQVIFVVFQVFLQVYSQVISTQNNTTLRSHPDPVRKIMMIITILKRITLMSSEQVSSHDYSDHHAFDDPNDDQHNSSYDQNYQVSSHILDTTLGKPAAGVVLTFSRLVSESVTSSHQLS